MKTFLLVLSVVSSVGTGHVMAKYGSTFDLYSFNHLLLTAISMTCFVLSFFLTVKVYRYIEVSRVAPVFSISSITISFLAGHFIFGEVVFPKDIFAIILGGIAIIILTTRGKKKDD